MRARTGRSTLGCLVTLLLVVTLGYFGLEVGEVYYRYFLFRDAMRQEVRFAGRRSDVDIRRRLAARAESLGLPESAGNISIRRVGSEIEIWSEYYEQVELPFFVREFHLVPQAEGRI